MSKTHTTFTISLDNDLYRSLERRRLRERRLRSEMIRTALRRFLDQGAPGLKEGGARAGAVAWGAGSNPREVRWRAMLGRYRRRRHVGYRLKFFTARVPIVLLNELEKVSRRERISKSQITSEALRRYLARK